MYKVIIGFFLVASFIGGTIVQDMFLDKTPYNELDLNYAVHVACASRKGAAQ